MGRRYWSVFAGFLINTVGDEFYLLALPLVLLHLGYPESVGTFLRSTLMVSTVLAGFAVGYLVDRYATHRLLTASYAASAAVLAAGLGLIGAGVDGYLVALVAAAVLGVFVAVTAAAVDAGIPRTVPGQDQVRRGYSMVESARAVAGIAGPAFAGAVAAARSLVAVIGINAASFAVAAVVTRAGQESVISRPAAARPSAWQLTRDGLRTVALHPELRIGIGLSLLVNVTLGADQPLFLVRAVRELGLSPAATSLIVVLAGVVGVVVSIAATRAAHRLTARTAMVGSVAVLAASAVVIGATGSVPLVSAAYCGLVAATVFYTVHWRTYRQQIVPADQLGRVSAACRSLAYAGIVAGTLLVGMLQEAGLHAGPLLVVGGLLCLAGVGLVPLALRRQRSRVNSTVTPSNWATGPE